MKHGQLRVNSEKPKLFLRNFSLRMSTKASEKALKIFDSALDVSCNGYEPAASEKWAPCVCDNERREDCSEDAEKHPGSVSCP